MVDRRGLAAVVTLSLLLGAPPAVADSPAPGPPVVGRVVGLLPRVVELLPRVVDLQPKAQEGGLAVPTDVLFAFGSSKLSSSAADVLGTLRARVAAARGKRVTITGHTDAIGTDSDNLTLSRRRAAAVRDFYRRTSPGVTFVVVGRGEAQPIAPDTIAGQDNPDGRRRNRRVTVVIGR